ncbi:hypothetical protein BJF81_06435 [Ornithinimicrobium sp. CNJ-824]|uniref:DUF937 domain-containing protein n=1 Tax=Ornithinimicrobium sp. CNJ-824 TaxID=1904966 RepID=UPI000961454B|nr:DUF937 domain-containing protein [Ornithinimicrobium sp. CNJ-824]OLT20026.1 hypothetical protein BJF81_06435 [Ornithinimicrobium sp. CNJ-824]
MLEDLMRAIPTDQLAQRVGAGEDETRQAVRTALPALLAGLGANAQQPQGAASLLDALGQHQDDLADNPRVDAVDEQDGEKIVNHVFGGQTDDVAQQLGGLGGAQTSSLVRKLLPILAPIVLSWLAKQVTGRAGGGVGDAGGRTTDMGGAGRADTRSGGTADGPFGRMDGDRDGPGRRRRAPRGADRRRTGAGRPGRRPDLGAAGRARRRAGRGDRPRPAAVLRRRLHPRRRARGHPRSALTPPPRGVPPGGVRVGMLCPPAPRPSRPPAAGSCVGAHRERDRPRRRCP